MVDRTRLGGWSTMQPIIMNGENNSRKENNANSVGSPDSCIVNRGDIDGRQ